MQNRPSPSWLTGALLRVLTVAILPGACWLLAGCNKKVVDQQHEQQKGQQHAAPRPGAVHEAPLTPGCELDSPAGRACFASNLSIDYPHLVDAVGSEKLLRDRLARAGVSRVRMQRVKVPRGEYAYKIAFQFDGQGRLTEEKNEVTGNRTVVEYTRDGRVTAVSYYDGSGVEFMSKAYQGNPHVCSIARRTRGRTEQTRCWQEGEQVLFQNRFERLSGKLQGNQMRFESGRYSVRDQLGRIIERKLSIQTHRYTYEPKRTREHQLAGGQQGQLVAEWSLNQHGLPVRWERHRWQPPHIVEMSYELASASR